MTLWDDLFRQEQNRWKETNKYVPLLEERLRRDFCLSPAPHRARGSSVSSYVEVLDIGCGTGRHLAYLESQGFLVFGFDASPAALQYARAKAPASYLKMHDMHDLPWPYPDSFFAGALAINVLHHGTMGQLEDAIKEISRISLPGGWLLATIASPENHKYGCGKMIDRYTFVPESGAEAGVPHCFPDFEEVEKIFTPYFQLYALDLVLGEVPEKDKSQQKGKDHWLVLGKKK